MSAAQARLQKDLGTKCRKIAACMRMRHRAGMREVMQMNTTHEIMPGVTYTIECIGIVLASSAPLFLSAALRVAFLGLGGIGGILILTPPPRPNREHGRAVLCLLVLVPRALEVGATRSDRARCAARRGWLPRR